MNGSNNFWIKRNYNKNVLTWEEVFENLQYSKDNNLEIKFKPPALFVCHNGEKINKLAPILKDLNCISAHIYINVFSQEINFGKHKDEMNVWFWQCKGETKWIIDGTENIVKEGDLIFVQKEVYHNVIALGPRVGVSMSNE